MITALLLSLALISTSDIKVDREAPPGCILAESFKSDLQTGGFFVASGDRDMALRYVAAIVIVGYPMPSVDFGKITEILIVTTPKKPDMVLIALVDGDGVICAATTVPRQLHESILRGA